MTKGINEDIQSVEQLDIFIESAPFGILMIDETDHIYKINSIAAHIFKYEYHELLGKKINHLINKSINISDEYLLQAFHQQQPVQQLTAHENGGGTIHIEYHSSIIELGGRKYTILYINKLDSATIHTHHRHNSQNSLNKGPLELINEKQHQIIELQRTILDNAKMMIFLMDATGTITFFNPEAVRITGVTSEEVEYKLNPSFFLGIDNLTFTPRELEYNVDSDIESASESDQFKKLILSNLFNEIECPVYHKNGFVSTVCLSITPLNNSEQEIFGFLGLAKDISERKKAEINLLESLKKEKNLNELKSRFVSMASHEFRTPLSTILSSAFLAEKYVDTEDQYKRKKHLDRIVQSVNILTNILNEFLNVGKIEEGKLTVHIKSINLPYELREDLNDLKSILKPGQRLDYQHEGMETVMLDNFMLKIIITNLVSNAIKFSPEDSVISIRTAVDADKIKISVKDEGIGISSEDQEHLMERFFRGANAVNIQGTGLGLHIVSKYVERLNGKIKCNSALLKGTTFNIIFYQKKLLDENDSVD